MKIHRGWIVPNLPEIFTAEDYAARSQTRTAFEALQYLKQLWRNGRLEFGQSELPSYSPGRFQRRVQKWYPCTNSINSTDRREILANTTLTTFWRRVGRHVCMVDWVLGRPVFGSKVSDSSSKVINRSIAGDE